MKQPAEELERRRPVWEAMSRLFLDTDLDQREMDQIAAILRASGYTPAELDAILWREVCPVLGRNLLSVAGEWSGFDIAALERQILRRPPGRWRSWPSRLGAGHLVRKAWARLRHLLEPQGDLRGQAARWDSAEDARTQGGRGAPRTRGRRGSRG